MEQNETCITVVYNFSRARGITVVLGEIQDNVYAQFWGGKQGACIVVYVKGLNAVINLCICIPST